MVQYSSLYVPDGHWDVGPPRRSLGQVKNIQKEKTVLGGGSLFFSFVESVSFVSGSGFRT
jgi:hypothetical protein